MTLHALSEILLVKLIIPVTWLGLAECVLLEHGYDITLEKTLSG